MEFVGNLFSAPTPGAVMAVVEEVASGFDVNHVSYRSGATAEALTIAISSLPQEWIAHYISSGYKKLDPGPHWAKHYKTPFARSFDPNHPNYLMPEKARGMTAELRSLGVESVINVPLPKETATGVAMASFFTSAPSRQFQNWRDAYEGKLQLLAATAHQRMHQLQSDSSVPSNVVPELSPREAEVLKHLAQGQRVDRIADHMSISNRTVEFHLRNAREKLGANTREQAVAAAIIDGLIAP